MLLVTVQRIYLPGDNDVGGEMWDDRVPFKVDRFNQYFRKEELVKSKFIDIFTVSVAVVANTWHDLIFSECSHVQQLDV